MPPRFVSLPMSYPRELIQHIYSYLHPRDFNAARHTCQSWMTASLDKALLTLMLKRAGWSPKNEKYIWGMSCRLARECALSSGWTGNGITDRPLTSPFRQSALIDFSELASGYNSSTVRKANGLIFTVSICGRYVLVAEGGMIYVYELVGDRLRVLTSVVCPRKVLAMSMDASSKRFAVAALLDGRMGLMCDLHVNRSDAEQSGSAALYPGAIVESSTGHRESDRNSLFTTRLYPGDDRLSLPQSSMLPHRRETRNQPSDFLDAPIPAEPPEYAHAMRRQPSDSFESADLDDPDPDPVELPFSRPPVLLEDTSSLAGRFKNYVNHSWNLQLTGFPYSPPVGPGSKDNNKIRSGIPVETGPRNLYRHLCSDEDPPRSVAICPQRQCVAFGCSTGLELHWVDALTGQDLNRWFPLTGPSDFLYFLPPRHGIDSPRKLRLISSAAHPSERQSVSNHCSSAARPTMSSFWSVVSFQSASPMQNQHPTFATANTSRLIPWVSDCDHYRAVPLSDGFHILFVDPESDMLCLGSDAPIGDPRRLLRKIMFVPPVEGAIPRMYASGYNFASGPRIVAAYNDTLVLYSVPSDVFALSRREQNTNKTMDEAEIANTAPWLQWWDKNDIPNNHPEPPSGPEDSDVVRVGPPKSVWPLFVRGQVLGDVEGLVDIAVNEVEGLSVWGFGADGRAGVWRVDNGEGGGVGLRVVERDGSVVCIPSVSVGFGTLGSPDERGWAAEFVL
ncbi:hypothetical protein FKW77_006906 [Venturia effusa]|uniref:F-box domain-containing protein n=1 Tax=Venturia effusa TaxID=50376 RepID=A0A517LB23_9PEZI|nr:hypothetical protein FKW77_006906 [Venturia effusa]